MPVIYAPCCLVGVCRRFGSACCLRYESDDRPKSRALVMESASTSETSANYYQTTRLNRPEDSHIHFRRREIVKSSLHYRLHRDGFG